MNNYTIYCGVAQTKKALELGAPVITKPYKGRVIENAFFIKDDLMCVFPTAEQMIGWLEERISYIDVIKQEDNTWLYIIYFKNNSNRNITVKGFSSRKDATLAAIDAALDYLEKQKENKQGVIVCEDSKESTAYTYEQMATLNLQLQGLINTKDEAFFKLREECERYKKKLSLIKNIIDNR